MGIWYLSPSGRVLRFAKLPKTLSRPMGEPRFEPRLPAGTTILENSRRTGGSLGRAKPNSPKRQDLGGGCLKPGAGAARLPSVFQTPAVTKI